jgi:hypothetical protein
LKKLRMLWFGLAFAVFDFNFDLEAEEKDEAVAAFDFGFWGVLRRVWDNFDFDLDFAGGAIMC